MIPVGLIAQLAEFFDRHNNASDPLSDDCLQAKRRFEELADCLPTARASDVSFSEFRYELVRQCREYLRKNRLI